MTNSKKIQLQKVGWHLESIVNQGVCSAILRHTDLEPKLDKLEGAPKKKKRVPDKRRRALVKKRRHVPKKRRPAPI